MQMTIFATMIFRIIHRGHSSKDILQIFCHKNYAEIRWKQSPFFEYVLKCTHVRVHLCWNQLNYSVHALINETTKTKPFQLKLKLVSMNHLNWSRRISTFYNKSSTASKVKYMIHELFIKKISLCYNLL